MGFWARSSSRSRAILSLTGGASAVIVIGIVLALARPPAPPAGPHPSPAVTHAPAPLQTTVPLNVTATFNFGPRHATAMTVSPGIVWLAAQGTTAGAVGTLIRVDATTARQTASWPVGGDPVAVAAGGDFVWVANSYGNSTLNLPEENTVEQFNAATGALVHTYSVPDPRGLVANPTSALAISAHRGQQTQVSLLSAGTVNAVTTLPGTLNDLISSLTPEVAVAVCSGQVFLALTNVLTDSSNVAIYALQMTGGSARKVATIPNDYEASIACSTTSVFVIGAAGNGNVSVSRVSSTGGSVSNMWEGPYPVAVAFLSGRVWIAYSDDTLNESFLTSLDPVTGIAASARSVLPPGPNRDGNLLIPGDSGLWFVASLGDQLLHVATG